MTMIQNTSKSTK